MILSIIKWLAFVWGTLAVSVMCYYAAIWFPHATDMRYNEMAIGFTMGAFYGCPSWLALPAYAVAQRKECLLRRIRSRLSSGHRRSFSTIRAHPASSCR